MTFHYFKDASQQTLYKRYLAHIFEVACDLCLAPDFFENPEQTRNKIQIADCRLLHDNYYMYIIES